MTAMDWATFEEWVRNKGAWKDQQIIGEDLFMAVGAGKQLLYIIPSLELVVVRQAPWGNEKYYRDMEFLSLLLRGQKNEDAKSA